MTRLDSRFGCKEARMIPHPPTQTHTPMHTHTPPDATHITIQLPITLYTVFILTVYIVVE